MKAKHYLLLIVAMLAVLPQTTAQTSQTLYLSGTGNDHTIDWEFFCTKGRQSGEWTAIPVPSCWELQGFGTYNYGLDLYNQDKKAVADEEGLYKYRFEVPDSWKKRQVYIVFQGSMTDTEVKINGKLAGPVHQGAFYRFEYNITKLLNYGKENLLEVKVSKLSANESVTLAERRADYWVFGGIFRPVYLEAHPQEFIDWTGIDAKADGSFLMDVHLKNIRKADEVEAQIQSLDGKSVGNVFSVAVDKNQTKAVLKTQVDKPDLWTPEFPNRYQVVVRLKQNGEIIHELIEKFGFRTVELRPRDGFYVNGQKVRFKGVNRHSFWPTSGRTTNKQLSITDVNLMKDMNMNAVRMSHYPPDEHFLDVCDSLGLFVLDELAGWQKPPYDTEVGKKLIREMVTRDVNHPCIVIWDNGNEGGNNHEIDDEFAKYDPQNRPLIHPWNIFRNTDTQHYKPFNYGNEGWFHGREVFFPTEFLHGLYDGGHGAGLDDFWRLMWQHPLSAGGFLWVFADEAVVRTDKQDSLDADGNHAPDGILGPYREKEGSFYTIKEIWSPVYINYDYLPPQFDGRLPVENRFHYTDLNQCTFAGELLKYPMPYEHSTEAQAQRDFTVKVPAVAPGHRGELLFDLPDDWQDYHSLKLSAYDPHDRLIYTWSWPIQSPAEMAEAIIKTAQSTKVEIKETSDYLTVLANGVELSFGKADGLLKQVRNKQGEISFSNGPLQDVQKEIEFQGVKHYREGETVVVEVSYGKYHNFNWQVFPSGWVKLDCAYEIWGAFDHFGLNFDYPEAKVKAVRYLGNGPYRVWKNRMKGVQFGLWEKAYNNTVTGESWDYPEFKGYHSDLYWAVLETEEQPFTVVSASENLFLRLYTPQRPRHAPKNNYTVPEFPQGDISFMHGITPIGTKFQAAEKLGAQGEKNHYMRVGNVPKRAVLYFDFGLKR